MINVYIDEFTHCLKDAKTGELVQTEVIRIRRKTFLRKYNKKNGWYINWEELLDENEIYAIVVEGSVDLCMALQRIKTCWNIMFLCLTESS